MADSFSELLGDDTINKPKSAREVAESYLARGWFPVPIAHREKGCKVTDWPNLRLTPDQISRHFHGGAQNVGVILGAASGGLIDIDLDSPEAVILAPDFLPSTGAVFGRAGNRASHYLFRVVGDTTTEKVACPATSKVLLELRGDGAQTVFPGSTHPTGELIEWASAGEPGRVIGTELRESVHRLAAAVMAARAFPGEGARHDATMALIGVLARSGWDDSDIVDHVTAVRSAAGAVSDHRKPIGKMVRDARKRLSDDKTLKGFPSFAASFGDAVAAKFAELLKLEPDSECSPDDFDDLDDLDSRPSGLVFLTPDQCDAAPGREYLWKGLIASGDLVCIFGDPGAGKSLLAPHLAYAVARGATAFGRRTKQGLAFYVAVEDSIGMRSRVRALRLENGEAPDFRLVEGVSELKAKGADLKALAAAVEAQKPSLIIIDTLAEAFPGLDENASREMGEVVAVGRSLTKHGAAVVLIHHGAKHEGVTPRGHSILNGALDLTLHVTRDAQGIVRAKAGKNRNGSTDADIAFRIAARELGQDEDGEPVTAAFVRELAAGEATSAAKQTPAAVCLSILQRLADNGGFDPAPSGWVSEKQWRAACADNRSVTAAEKAESRERVIRKLVRDLAVAGLIEIKDDMVRAVRIDGADAFDDLPG